MQAEEGGPAVFVEVPDDVRDRLGKKRAPVRGTINGTPFRSTIAVYGARGLIPVPRRLRERAGIAPGEGLVVELERDDEPREVDVPPDLEAALAADEEARAAFTKLSYSHRKEYVAWIEEAVRAETRRRRIERTVGRLREGSR
ncbi:MAG TPA: DUF1905 domain-containing protein [Actinomycetota bacterium]|nr:DUF1905 domain-containing protein [Actinomycetota bacterium]